MVKAKLQPRRARAIGIALVRGIDVGKAQRRAYIDHAHAALCYAGKIDAALIDAHVDAVHRLPRRPKGQRRNAEQRERQKRREESFHKTSLPRQHMPLGGMAFLRAPYFSVMITRR